MANLALRTKIADSKQRLASGRSGAAESEAAAPAGATRAPKPAEGAGHLATFPKSNTGIEAHGEQRGSAVIVVEDV